MLQLQLFGGFKLSTFDGQNIVIRLFKDRALLAYLALNSGRLFSRSALAGFLWGDQAEEKARHSLSQSLSSICDSLGPHSVILERGRKQIVLKKESMRVDLVEFFNLAAQKNNHSCHRAIKMYKDDILSEVDFNEPAFEDWVTEKRIAAQLCAIESGLLVLASQDGSGDSSRTDIAQKLIHVDPFCEPAHQHLIRQYVKSGNLKSAHRQFKTCEKLLLDELGIEPAPETRRALEPAIGQFVSNENYIDTVEKPKSIPSLVVLPIDNISGDPSLDFLSLGLADDITTELTRFRDLFVISRESAFGLDIIKDTSPSVCLRLGVRHCLRGAFRRIGNQFRINLHLVDGETGQSVWSERYDLSETELIELPGEITRQIVGRLAAWLEREALARTRNKPTSHWSAYDHLLKGLEHHHQSWYSTSNLKKAIRHFEQAIKIDPECARAYAYLACAKSTPYFRNRDNSMLGTCEGLARHAVDLDPAESEAHRVLGGVHLCRGEHELSRQYFEAAEGIHPGHAHILAHTARYHTYTGNPDKAINLLGRARQLNPSHPPWYWEHVGMAYFGKHSYNAALDAFNRLQQHSFYDQLYVGSVNAFLGNKRNALHHIAIAVSKNPRLRGSNVAKYFPYSKPEDLHHLLDGLKMGGLSLVSG